MRKLVIAAVMLTASASAQPGPPQGVWTFNCTEKVLLIAAGGRDATQPGSQLLTVRPRQYPAQLWVNFSAKTLVFRSQSGAGWQFQGFTVQPSFNRFVVHSVFTQGPYTGGSLVVVLTPVAANRWRAEMTVQPQPQRWGGNLPLADYQISC